jgi:hypothetical protein
MQDYHAKYIELMCRIEPNMVMFYLKQQQTEYNLESMIALCRKFNVIDALAWLLEKKGDLTQAYSLLFAVCLAQTAESSLYCCRWLWYHSLACTS